MSLIFPPITPWHQRPLWACSIGLCLFLSVAGCREHKTSAPAPEAVRVAKLVPEEITLATRFSATVRPRQSVDLAFKVPGRVQYLYKTDGLRFVQEGDRVAKDTILAKLDTADAQRDVDVANAQLGAVTEAVRKAQSNLDQAQRDFERTAGLYERRVATQKEFEDNRTRLDAAKADHTGAQRNLEAAAGTLAQAGARLQDCTLQVPINNATIVLRAIEPDEVIPAGRQAFRIMDVSEVRVAFGVPDTMLGGALAGESVNTVSLGQEIEIQADAFEGSRFTGRITKIAAAADADSRTFLTEVTVPNPDGRLKSGMIVTLSVGQKRSNMLLVPMHAVQRGVGPQDTVLYVINEKTGNTAQPRQVRLGAVYDQRVEIRPGSEVKPGDRIVISGANRIVTDQPLIILPADPSPAVRP